MRPRSGPSSLCTPHLPTRLSSLNPLILVLNNPPPSTTTTRSFIIITAGFLSLDVDGRVVRVDTLAKLLGPGFRLGWLTGPPALVAKLGLYMAGISIGANMVSQVCVCECVDVWEGGQQKWVR